MDYQGNSHKGKKAGDIQKEKIEKVVVSEVIVPKKPLGRKVKDLFIVADLGSVARYVVADVLFPAARNMIFDAITEGAKRAMYGDSFARRHGPNSGTQRTAYYNPFARNAVRDSRMAPPVPIGPRSAATSRHIHEDFILSTRDEAELVLERMRDLIDKYEVASVVVVR